MATRALQVVITGDSKQFGRSLDHAGKDADAFGGRVKKSAGVASKALKGLAVVGAGAAVVGLSKSVDAAIEAEKSQAKLVTQLKASGIAYKDHAKHIDDVIQKTSQLSGLDDEDLQDSFTNIVRVTGDVNKSLKLTGLAADFARAKHIEVAKAGEIVGKVAGGNTGILARYGIQIDENATSSEALAELQKKFSGQADAYGKTTAGSLDRMHVSSENLGEVVGGKLTPILADVADKIANFINQMKDGKGAGGRFRKTLEDIYHAVKPIVKFFKDHPKLIGAAVGAWAVYKGAVVATVIAGKMQAFRKMFTGGAPAATAAGATTGTAYSRSFAATSSAGVKTASGKGGRLRGAFVTSGRSLGAAMGIASAAMFGVELAKGVEAALGEIAPSGDKTNKNSAGMDRRPTGSPGAGWNLFEYIKNKVGKGAGDVVSNMNFGATLGGGSLGGMQTAGLQTEAKRGLGYIQSRFGNVRVSSGWRSKKENAAVGGAPNSDHLRGLALDLVPAEGWTSGGTARLDRIAAWARKSPAIRWIGWRGVKGHGPGDHLHLSFMDRVAGDVAMVGGRLKAFGGRVRGKGDVVGDFRRAISSTHAPPKAALALWEAGIVESGLRNLTYGDRDSQGALQLRTGIWGEDLAMDPYRSAVAFLNRGFWGKGGAISIAKHNPKASAGWVAQQVQGSGVPGAYDKVAGRARGYLARSSRRGGGGGGGSSGPRTGSAGPSTGGLGPGMASGGAGQTAADIGLAEATARANDNLPGLIAALSNELRLKQRRAKHIRRYLKRRRVSRANRKKFTEELTALVTDIAELKGTLKEYQADAKGGAKTISAAEELTAGVADSAGASGGESAADTALAQAIAFEADTQQRLIDELKSVKDEIKALNANAATLNAVGYREALKFIADGVSGQVVGRNLSGRRSTAGNGASFAMP